MAQDHAPLGVGNSSHGADPPLETALGPTIASTPHTLNHSSDSGPIGLIQLKITEIATKFAYGAPEQSTLALIASTITELQRDKTWLQRQLEAQTAQLSDIHAKLDTAMKISMPIGPQNTLKQPSWSAIVAGGVLAQPRQTPIFSAYPALAALKSPPPCYNRELIARRTTTAEQYEHPIQRLVEELNKAASRGAAIGQVQTVRRLPSGDTVLRFDTTVHRDSWKETQEHWINVLGPGAHLKQRHYTVIVQGMRKKECQDPTTTIKELYQVNPRLQQAGVEILRIAFQKRFLASDRATGPLLVSVAEPEQANEMVRQEINWRYQAHNCELFEGNSRPVQCYKCNAFGHMAVHCRGAARCGFCSKIGHKPDECIVKDDAIGHRCTNCKGHHAAWFRDCLVVREQRERALIAYNNRPIRYRVDGIKKGPTTKHGTLHTTQGNDTTTTTTSERTIEIALEEDPTAQILEEIVINNT